MSSTRRVIHMMLNEAEMEFSVEDHLHREAPVYFNPTAEDMKSMLLDGWDSVRAFIYPNGDMVAWTGPLHGVVRRALPEWIEKAGDPIPAYVYTDGSENAIVVVTDAATRTQWHHNPETASVIQKHRALRKLFSHIEINYYDESIVGDWADIQESPKSEYCTFVDAVKKVSNEFFVSKGFEFRKLKYSPKSETVYLVYRIPDDVAGEWADSYLQYFSVRISGHFLDNADFYVSYKGNWSEDYILASLEDQYPQFEHDYESILKQS